MKIYRYEVLIALSVLLFPMTALAQTVPDGGGILEQIVDQFQAASSGWASTMQGFALGLFGLLATISFMYNTIMYALRGEAQLYGWMGHVVKEILRIGFWFAVLLSATTWIPAIVDSLRQAGEAAGGAGTLSPTNALSTGINIAKEMLERSAGTGGVAQVIGAYITDGVGAALGAGLSNIAFQIAALIIVLVFAYMALQIIIALVEMYFVTSAGVLFIGMGGSSWTADFAVKTLVYAVSVGAKLMVMALILGIGMQVAQQWMDLDYTNFSTSVIVIGCSVVLAGVVKMVPQLVQSMIQGASVTSAAPMIGAATSMAAAAGAAATAGVGAGMALHSATSMAAGQLGAATAAGAGPTTAGGRAALMASNTAKNLAGAAAQDIGGRLAGSNRQGTMGGRMASAMNDQMKRDERAPSPGAGGGSGGGAGSTGAAGGGTADAATASDTPSVTISGAGEGSDAGGTGSGSSDGGGAAAAGAAAGDSPSSSSSTGGGSGYSGDASGSSSTAGFGGTPSGGGSSTGSAPSSSADASVGPSAPRSGGVVSGPPRPGGVVSGGPAGGGSLISGGPSAPPPAPAGSYSSPAVSLGDALGGYGSTDSDSRRGIGEASLAEDQTPNYQPVDSDSKKGLGEAPTRRPPGPADHLRGPGNDNESG